MSIKDQLTQGLKDAMRNRDELRKRTFRLAIAEIKNAEIDSRSELDEPAILAILQKEVKIRHETIEAAERAGRDDMIVEAKAEIRVLEEFLPQPLTIQEIEELAQKAIAETGATTPREMGSVMKLLVPEVQGRADGKTVSQIVRKLLTG